MTGPLVVLLAVDLLIFAPLCGWLAVQKGRPLAEGAIVGAVFGLFGILVIGLAPAAKEPTRACPRCAEQIQAAASACRFCGQAVQPVATLAARTGPSLLLVVLMVAVAAGLTWLLVTGLRSGL